MIKEILEQLAPHTATAEDSTVPDGDQEALAHLAASYLLTAAANKCLIDNDRLALAPRILDDDVVEPPVRSRGSAEHGNAAETSGSAIDPRNALDP